MSHLALYRKYRPQAFEDVVGQEHIVSVLKNAVRLGRIAHAYIFAGPRGTGKTSLARIMAREAGSSEIDLVEIDGASNRGVDEIRALREGVRSYPLQGKVKVYIIDEVHMLTGPAFNALLKTLEEPPAHVIFILATTDLEKVPETVVSRCQTFSFRTMPVTLVAETLIKTAKKEGLILEKEAGAVLALFAEGSMRDALGLLDQIISLSGSVKDKKITESEVRKFLSVPPSEMVENFVSFVLNDNASGALKIIQNLGENNLDIQMFFKLVLRTFRAILLVSVSPNLKDELAKAFGEREINFIFGASKEYQIGKLHETLIVFLDAVQKSERSFASELPLEMAVIKATRKLN